LVRENELINKMPVISFPRRATPNKLDETHTNGTVEKGGVMGEEEKDDTRTYLREGSLEAKIGAVLQRNGVGGLDGA